MAVYTTRDPTLVLHHASLSDIGCQRQSNEDATGFVALQDPARTFLLVVADGVGGNQAGEVASSLAVDTVGREFFRQAEAVDPATALREALGTANGVIYQAAQADPSRAGMATTCTAAVIRGRDLVVGHVGDSRAYLAGNGHIQQLTEDHSLAAEYARRGSPLPESEKILGNVLTRWLGTAHEVTVDIIGTLQLPERGCLVLCSDGLTKVVAPEEIQAMVTADLPAEACRRLVELAKERGGPDNITVQVALLAPI